LLDATEHARTRTRDRDGRIFIGASVTPAGELRFSRWGSTTPRLSLR
jgi:hypothetical protein